MVVQREIDAGWQFSSAVGYTYTFDSRTTGLDPNAGYLFQFGQDLSGLGGDSDYLRTNAKIIGQRRIFGEEIVLRATLEGGALSWFDGTNRTVDRFFVGPDILRGFEPGGIGPRDFTSPGDADPLGGNYYFAARFDADFPIGLPEEWGIRTGVFYDIGNLWNLDDVNTTGGDISGEGGSLRQVIGFSILWDSAFGPLRFNFTHPIKKKKFDKDQFFDVTLSTDF